MEALICSAELVIVHDVSLAESHRLGQLGLFRLKWQAHGKGHCASIGSSCAASLTQSWQGTQSNSIFRFADGDASSLVTWAHD